MHPAFDKMIFRSLADLAHAMQEIQPNQNVPGGHNNTQVNTTKFTKYKCEKHGEVTSIMQVKQADKPEVIYCQSCFIDMIDKHCEKVTKIEENKDGDNWD